MGRKATKKFASSGKLKKTIQARQKHKKIIKTIEGRRGARNAKRNGRTVVQQDEDEEDEDEIEVPKRMTVDDFLGAGFMQGGGSNSDEDGSQDFDDGTEPDHSGEDDIADDASFASVDDLEDEGETHLQELSKLAEKDPEFYQYLQENDRELLEFDPNNGDDSDASMSDGDQDQTVEDKVPVLTKVILQKWQKTLLEQRSLRSLRKLLIAFRSAVYMNEEDHTPVWTIDSSKVYNKLLITTLRYAPVVLSHHVPVKVLPNGHFKPPTQTPKLKTLQKMILSYFHNVINLLSQLSDTDMLEVAITESAKIIPYIITSRKAIKTYLKKCLELWCSSADNVRIAAYVAIRKLACSSDDTILDHILKGSYMTLIRSSKSTTVYTLPAINLMKNSASEVFCMNHVTTYQHAFGYIRQLAIHLRNSIKSKTKESYKLVYNWQYVHCVDFWSIVLARACDARNELATGKESDLKTLIYPLVQVSLGAIKLISNSRSYPFHLHIIHSLLHLTRHTGTYVPISPYILPILTTTLAAGSRPKSSTLRPLDFETHIRAPQQYAKTRIYAECLVEETSYLLAEWLCSSPVHGSISFPEIVVPIVVLLRKSIKSARSNSNVGKELNVVKTLVERIEESATWLENKRRGVSFAPAMTTEVNEWEKSIRLQLDDSPLGKYLRVQQKAREKRQKLLDKAQVGEDEILED
ncbi:Noc2-domain-containing protein [Pluteus cervinus]|uniref:Noc2-domain-containing protein n=1 Tax=Pluteus cervinus TaxID=181527 RepID=A0ACD3AVM0_9AGAR|nr:Noc2-domain-containing protein [Pluteus cervinus]